VDAWMGMFLDEPSMLLFLNTTPFGLEIVST